MPGLTPSDACNVDSSDGTTYCDSGVQANCRRVVLLAPIAFHERLNSKLGSHVPQAIGKLYFNQVGDSMSYVTTRFYDEHVF